MCKKLFPLFLLSAPLILTASVTFNGSALRNNIGLASGDFGVLLVDTNNLGFGSLSIAANTSLTNTATYGSNFALITPSGATASTFIGVTTFSGNATFDLSASITAGDKFAVLVFDTSTTTAINGDTFRIWTDASWVVPADGSVYTFTTGTVNPTSQFPTLSSAANFTGTVGGSPIPEPSAFAVAAGLAALGFVAIRRRR